MATAAYEGGDAWLDELCGYLAGNAEVFDEGIRAIPSLRSMPMQATYLAWVDFAGTGMEPAEFTARVEQGARIAASHGPTFGTGGESFLRFNIATPRARVAEAVRRLQAAFADLQ
jgi:cystathionine beta-lyase